MHLRLYGWGKERKPQFLKVDEVMVLGFVPLLGLSLGYRLVFESSAFSSQGGDVPNFN